MARLVQKKSVALLCTNDKMAEKAIRKTTPFTVATSNIKMSWGNSNQHSGRPVCFIFLSFIILGQFILIFNPMSYLGYYTLNTLNGKPVPLVLTFYFFLYTFNCSHYVCFLNFNFLFENFIYQYFITLFPSFLHPLTPPIYPYSEVHDLFFYNYYCYNVCV